MNKQFIDSIYKDIVKRAAIPYSDAESIIDRVNIIGVDFGDGEFCVSVAFREGNKITIREYRVVDGEKGSDYTVYYRVIDKNTKTEKEDIGNGTIKLKKRDEKDGLETYLYANFKRPPNHSSAYQKYEYSMDSDELTYLEIMQRSFNLIINNCFKYNTILTDKSQTVIFVGRPSTEQWKKSEQDYAKLLLNKLNIENYKGEKYVVVDSEAMAAMAFAAKEGRISKRERVFIFDIGSSTLDAFLINPNGTTDEYSRQAGAGMIEDNMLKQFLYDAEELKKLDSGALKENELKLMRGYNDLVTKIEDKLNLRGRKEDWYGPNGNDGNSSPDSQDESSSAVGLKNGQRSEKRPINSEFMDRAVCKTGVHVIASDPTSTDPYYAEKDFASFYDACRNFFEGAKKRFGDSAPDKILLAGGASVMPFISDIIFDIFKIKPEPAVNAAHGAANGLAYMGYVELKKREELEKMTKDVESLIGTYDGSSPNPNYQCLWDAFTLKVKCAEVIADYLWTDVFEPSIKTWAEKSADSSWFSWWESLVWDIPYSAISTSVQSWFNQIKAEQLQKIIDDRFKKLFPNSNYIYKFYIDKQVLVKAFNAHKNNLVLRGMNKYKLQGKWNGFWGPFQNTSLTRQRREDFKNNVINRKIKIKELLREQFSKQLDGSLIIKSINDALKPKLEEHIDVMTPYFIEYK